MGITGVQDRQAPAVERTRRARLDRPPDRMTGPQVADGCSEYSLGPERPSPGLRKRRRVPGSRSRRTLIRASRGITDRAASPARPWPSVEKPTVHTDRPGGRTPSAICPWTPRHSGPQRYKVTQGGTQKKRPAQPRIPS
jgi:hypothetical protein